MLILDAVRALLGVGYSDSAIGRDITTLLRRLVHGLSDEQVLKRTENTESRSSNLCKVVLIQPTEQSRHAGKSIQRFFSWLKRRSSRSKERRAGLTATKQSKPNHGSMILRYDGSPIYLGEFNY